MKDSNSSKEKSVTEKQEKPVQLTNEEFARICWEASTKGELSVLTQREIDKSRQFDTAEMQMLVR